jgi:hypothetical protein
LTHVFLHGKFGRKACTGGTANQKGAFIGGGLFGDKKTRAILLNWDFLSKESLSTNRFYTQKKHLQINQLENTRNFFVVTPFQAQKSPLWAGF